MEEKNLTEKESIALITEMISRTKKRLVGNGDILLLWGYLVVAVSIAVWVLLVLTRNQFWNIVWFVIPITGGILTPILAKKDRTRTGATTYSDRIISQIWLTVGCVGFLAMIACFVMTFVFWVDSWTMMLMFTLFLVPFAEIVQGIVLREGSFIFGGAVGFIVGIITSCCVASGIPLEVTWYMPLFIVAFIAMMIIPGHIINYKAKHA